VVVDLIDGNTQDHFRTRNQSQNLRNQDGKYPRCVYGRYSAVGTFGGFTLVGYLLDALAKALADVHFLSGPP